MLTSRASNEIRLGPVDTIPIGEGRAFQVRGQRIAVFRLRDGSVYAAQNECPHAGGPLAEGLAGCGQVICPLHAWRFDLTSGACLNNPSHCLRTYPVRVEAGWLVLTLG